MERVTYWQELKDEIYAQEEEIKSQRLALADRERFLKRLCATVEILEAQGVELEQPNED